MHPSLPYERYRYEPHTRGLDEFNNVPSTIAKLIALHTREKYGVTTMYNRLKNDEISQQAQTMAKDLNTQFSRGYGVDDNGKFVQMPQPAVAVGPVTPVKEYPRGEELRRRMMMPRQPLPADTAPKPQGMPL